MGSGEKHNMVNIYHLLHHKHKDETKNVPKGCMAIMVGREGEEQLQRFVIPIIGTNADDQSEHEKEEEDEDEDNDDYEEEVSENDAEPIGDVVRVSDNGGEKRNHFSSFQFDGMLFHLEDTVLVAPEEGIVKPSVAIIKDIFQAESGSLQVCGRRFYRPEEAEKMEGGTWESDDARELFCSSYLDDLDAATVMHKCVIHLVPLGRTLPDRKEQPGFIVQKFYDFGTKKIRNLSARDCEGILLLQPEAV